MKFLRSVCFIVLASGLMLGQNSVTTSSSSDNIADDLKKLREAIAEQQKQIAKQQEQIQKLEQQLADRQRVSVGANAISPRLVPANLSTSSSAANAAARTASEMQTQPQSAEAQGAKSPLSFRIGAAEFTPGGFVDFENIFRSTNTGNVAATSFGAIPFSNTVQGHLTEYRSTGQYSRFNIKTTTKFGKNDVTGYVEFDFNGNDAGNVFVTANGHTSRMRLYWLDLKRGKWEFLGGSTWGLETPNRVGVSPNPADLSLGYQEDSGIGTGYNYTRAGEFRTAYHFNDKWVWAVAVQNPQQFTNGEVVFPAGFNAQLTAGTNGQFDAGAQPGVPNLSPDVITKVAYDNDKIFGNHHFHLEFGGIETAVKATVLAPSNTAAAKFHSISTVGGGFMGGVNFELWKGAEGRNITLVAQGMGGYGVGRYLNGLAPQVVVIPISAAGSTCTIVGTNAVGCDARTSLVHSYDGVGGFEIRPHPKTQLGAYYGGMYAQRNFGCDITATGAGACSGKPFIGFGFPGSATNQNRAVQQGFLDWTQTFWRNPQYGAVLLVTQASYLTRAPWFVAAGAPKNAHLGMGFVSLRYVLP